MPNNLDINRKALALAIRSHGGAYLIQRIDEQMKEGWEKFIALPVEKKTSKAAFHAQAQYSVLKDLKDWIESELRMSLAE